jgi:MerR family transcriptional regulator, mercuric resistance operon regulatory protein
MNGKVLRSGELASKAGVSVATLRYYERRGLIPRPARSESGYRAYPPGTVEVVRMIKQAQKLQFSLREIGELLELRGRPEATCADVHASGYLKLQDLETRIATLTKIRDRLAELLSTCSRRDEVRAHDCPFFAELAGQPQIKPV